MISIKRLFNLPAVFALLFLLVQAPVFAADGIPKRDSHEFGKTLVDEYDVPEDVIYKYNNRTPAKQPNAGSPLINMMLSESVDWTTDIIDIDDKKNPYRMVVTVAGTAIADGDAISMWTSGWMKDGTTKAQPLVGLSQHNVKAGERFVITAASNPSTFKDSQQLFATLGMVKTTNMTINAVHVQIWSGVASASFTQIFFSLQGLVVALILLGLGWYFKRR